MFRCVTFLGFCAAALVGASVRTNDSEPIIDLGYAKYRGVINQTTGIKTFYGIRYAAPPIKELRWRPPLNTEEFSYMTRDDNPIIDATKPGPMCVQGDPAWRRQSPKLSNPTKAVWSSEDCLLLDVSVPVTPVSSNLLPVMVQIHGGGYTGGDAGFYPGDSLMIQAKGAIIYISIQYRLGAYGFLSSNAVKADGVPNVGLLDQRAALTWVQNHIAVFGGDSERVTLVGGSAGGGSITAQMMLYGGSPGNEKPPFSGAIIEYPWWQPFHAENVLETQYQQLLQAAGCSDLGCLRNVSAEVLAAAAQETYVLGYSASPPPLYGYGDFYWGPSVDGDIIRGLPSREFQRGAFSSVPLLTNHETYEGYSFTNASELTVDEETNGLRNLFPNATGEFVDRLYDLYPSSNFNSTFWHRQTWFGDAIINCPSQWIADAVELLGKPAYRMIFNAGTGRHGATKTFVFNTGFGSSPNDNVTISELMKDWYLSFAVHQDPNEESFSKRSPGVTWPRYGYFLSPIFKRVLNVNAASINVGDDPDANERCSFWRSQSAVTRN